MNSLGNLRFERVQVINLQKDTGRLDAFYRRLPSDWPFNRPEVFRAIDGSLAPPPDWWPVHGSGWGCLQSHLRVIEAALNDNVSSLLVLEDDATFIDDFIARLRPFAEELPADWNWLYLGGQHIQKSKGIPCRVGDNLYRPFNVHRAHCYGLQGRETMERVYRHLNSPEDWSSGNQVDHRLGELHADFPGAIFVPPRWLVGQAGGYSNIKRKHLNENFYPDTIDIVSPQVQSPMVAVVGADSATRNLVAAMIHLLGVSMGTQSDQAQNRPWETQGALCAPGLDEICGSLYSDSWWIEKTNDRHRRALLAGWASRRSSAVPVADGAMGGTHPTFCVLADELLDAWNRPLVFLIDPRPSHLIDPQTVRRCNLERQRNGLFRYSELPFEQVVTIDFNTILDSDRLLAKLRFVLEGKCLAREASGALEIAREFRLQIESCR